MYNGILFSLKRQKGNPIIYDNMDELGGHFTSATSQAQKDKCRIISLICRI
jgi:hypothetical protein